MYGAQVHLVIQYENASLQRIRWLDFVVRHSESWFHLEASRWNQRRGMIDRVLTTMLVLAYLGVLKRPHQLYAPAQANETPRLMAGMSTERSNASLIAQHLIGMTSDNTDVTLAFEVTDSHIMLLGPWFRPPPPPNMPRVRQHRRVLFFLSVIDCMVASVNTAALPAGPQALVEPRRLQYQERAPLLGVAETARALHGIEDDLPCTTDLLLQLSTQEEQIALRQPGARFLLLPLWPVFSRAYAIEVLDTSSTSIHPEWKDTTVRTWVTLTGVALRDKRSIFYFVVESEATAGTLFHNYKHVAQYKFSTQLPTGLSIANDNLLIAHKKHHQPHPPKSIHQGSRRAA